MKRLSIVAALVSAGCASGPPAPPDACWAVRRDGSTGGSRTVVVDDSVREARAPIPSNDAEAIAFAGAHDTLVRVDCDGRARPALALEWAAAELDRVWTIRLRAGAVSAEDVRRIWGSTLSAHSGRAGVVAHWVRPDSVRSLSPNELEVRLTESVADFPWVLAHPAFAIPRAGADESAVSVVPRESSVLSVVLLSDADVIVTREPPREPLRGGASFARVELPPDRRYLVLRTDDGTRSYWPADLTPNVVGANASPIFEAFFGRGHGALSPAAIPEGAGAVRAIVCLESDAVARAIAGRIAGLDRSARVEALPPREYRAALRAGRGAAFVYVVDRMLATPSLQRARLAHDAPWVSDARIDPLVETHATLFVKSGGGPVWRRWDAVPRFDDPAPARP